MLWELHESTEPMKRKACCKNINGLTTNCRDITFISLQWKDWKKLKLNFGVFFREAVCGDELELDTVIVLELIPTGIGIINGEVRICYSHIFLPSLHWKTNRLTLVILIQDEEHYLQFCLKYYFKLLWRCWNKLALWWHLSWSSTVFRSWNLQRC